MFRTVHTRKIRKKRGCERNRNTTVRSASLHSEGREICGMWVDAKEDAQRLRTRANGDITHGSSLIKRHFDRKMMCLCHWAQHRRAVRL